MYKNKAFLHQKYDVEKRSIKEIAAEISSSRSAVSKHLVEHGIREPYQFVRPKWRSQLKYGEAWRDRLVVPYKRELENIERMKRLREQGFSYWKIADVFNSMKIPTKSGRGKWHARYIQKILEEKSTLGK